MTREDQRLVLTSSALTGLLAQHEANHDKLSACHYTDDELADAAMRAVKVADLALTAIGARIPTPADVHDMLGECWELLWTFVEADAQGWFGSKAAALLARQKGERHAR